MMNPSRSLLIKPIAFIWFLVITPQLLAQKETNWWYFGKNISLNFNNITGGLPEVKDVSSLETYEANSTIFESDVYSISAKGECGQISDTIEISSCHCTMRFPNVFTPNGDGYNDSFKPIDLCDIESYSLSVFNRWGVEVFNTKVLNDFWLGEFNGKSCVSGVYFLESRIPVSRQ